MSQEKLITDAEKIHFKSKLIPILKEIERRKQLLFRVRVEVEKSPEDEIRKSETERHRDKIYEIEERSYQLDHEKKMLGILNMFIAEANLYATLINNESTVDGS